MTIGLNKLLNSINKNFINQYGNFGIDFIYEFKVDGLIDVDKSNPISLMLNEFVINSIKLLLTMGMKMD